MRVRSERDESVGSGPVSVLDMESLRKDESESTAVESVGTAVKRESPLPGRESDNPFPEGMDEAPRGACCTALE